MTFRNLHTVPVCALLAFGSSSCTTATFGAAPTPPEPPALTCQQIDAERVRLMSSLDDLYPRMRKESRKDSTYWLNIVWPLLFSPSKNAGPALAEYKDLQAAYIALKETSVRRPCDIHFFSIEMEVVNRAYAEDKNALQMPKPVPSKLPLR